MMRRDIYQACDSGCFGFPYFFMKNNTVEKMDTWGHLVTTYYLLMA